MNWVFLAIAITGEVIGTSALKASEGFTRVGPSTITAIGFAIAFYFLALALRTIPMGIAYAIWSGTGIVVISLVGYFYYKQALDLPALCGIGLILAGVLVINTLSNSAAH
ncbi:MAG: QacE family quaternary ammonium compound efflux SMR transporter [Hyphomicrobiales bacterium]|nr:QacE family quaternary ammonium compound efflux SMR transporter [Hyphomicrobiales bacterium]MCP4998107.1 QacE family quaternary ammonium compound efflux SMR transporter [Hyphomicrobiales bacterium]